MLLVYFKKSFFVRSAVFLGCLCTALALHHNAHSQDSLETKLRTARDAEKLTLLEQLYRNYQASDFNKAIQFADAGISVANKLDDIRYVVVFNKYKASSLMDLGRNEEAVDILLPALKLARDNSISDQEMFILNNIGLAYTYRGIYDSALSFHFKSLELREKSGRKASMFNSLNNIGLVYYKLKNPKLALNFYQRALDIKTQLNDNTGVYALQVNIGLCYVSLNEYANAISIINRALQSCGPSSSCDGKVLVDAYHAIGIAYLGVNDLAKSETSLLKSYTLSQQRNDTRYMIENLEALSSVDLGNKQFEAAIKKLQQAEVLANNTDFVENRITIYGKLAEEYKRISDYQKATIYQDRYIKLKDSVYNDKLISNLAVVQTNYAERVNLKTISEQNEIILLKDDVLAKQQTITVMAIAMALLLLSFTYFAIQSQRSYNTRLKRHNDELEVKVQERTRELSNTVAELDSFIYKSYHDLKGPLSRLKGLSTLIKMDPLNSNEYNEEISKTSDQLAANLLQIQRVSEINKHTVKLEEVDLVTLVGESLERLRSHKNYPLINFSLSLSAKTLVIDKALFSQAFQAILQNAFDYAKVNRGGCQVAVSSWVEKNSTVISIADNGIGVPKELEPTLFGLFAKGEVATGSGLGLHLAKFSMDKAGGSVVFKREAMTTFILAVPNTVSS